MRIISKYHDYYDTALSFGIDQQVLYLRDEAYDDGMKYIHLYASIAETAPCCIVERGCGSERFEARTHLVGFCGKIYPVLAIEYRCCRGGWRYETVTDCLYDVAGVEAALSRLGLDYVWEQFNRPISKKGNRKASLFSRQNFEEFFGRYSGAPLLGDIFVEKKVPAFLLRLGSLNGGLDRLTLNPVLADLKFFRRFDAVDTFQEIAMFIGGVLGSGGPRTVTIDDRRMAEKKGFDRMSFRATSPGKKARRRGIVFE